MSGIEAVIGVAAGAAGLLSLALQLGDCALKLRRIYHAAKDAPRKVERAVNDLEMMALALQQLEQQRLQQRLQDGENGSRLLMRCITSCQQSTAEIQELVNKIDNYMKQNHVGIRRRLYATFKERDVKELLDDLERAKRSLELAYMIYISEGQRRQAQDHGNALSTHSTLLRGLQTQISAENTLILQKLERPALERPAQLLPLPQPRIAVSNSQATTGDEVALVAGYHLDTSERPDECSRFLPVGQVRRKRSQTRLRIGIRLSTWLCRRVWEVALTQAQCRWSIHLSTYHIITIDSPILYYCSTGNLSRVRELTMGCGETTPLDAVVVSGATGDSLTLLEFAASSGHLEMCRYILGQTTWPNHATILHRALSLFVQTGQGSAEVYRLFMGNYGFDADLGLLRHDWLLHCPDAESLEVVLMHNQPSGLDFHQIEDRFELVSRMINLKPSVFLSCLGISSSDTRLAYLRNSSGASVLHWIAFSIRAHNSQELLNLGVSVLKNGADPCSIAGWENYSGDGQEQDEECRTTPLMACLSYRFKHGRMRGVSNARSLTRIRLWADMIQRAGLDLCDYGSKESGIWKSLDVHNHSNKQANPETWDNMARIERLVYGPTPTDWTLEVHFLRLCSVYELRPPPGAFPEEHRLPMTIIWPPRQTEENEGPWMLVRSAELPSKSVELIDLPVHPRHPFFDLVEGTQDDSGSVMLMQYRASRTPNAVSRSQSQPASLRHRRYESEPLYSRWHPWLKYYHRCPFYLEWRLDCECFGREGYTGNYTEGIWQKPHSAQELLYWSYGSFLAEITACRDRTKMWVRRQSAESLRHTKKHDCPQGCGNVDINQLNVPESLWRYHPWQDEDED